MSKDWESLASTGMMRSGESLAASLRRLESGSTPTPHWEMGTFPFIRAPSALMDSRPSRRTSSASEGGLRPSSCACSCRHMWSIGTMSTLRFW